MTEPETREQTTLDTLIFLAWAVLIEVVIVGVVLGAGLAWVRESAAADSRENRIIICDLYDKTNQAPPVGICD
jgi:hypothetical protein